MRKKENDILLQDAKESIVVMARLGFVAVFLGYAFSLLMSLLGYIPNLITNTGLHTLVFVIHFSFFKLLKKHAGLTSSPSYFLLTCICTSYAFWIISIYHRVVPDMYTLYYVLPVISALLLDIRHFFLKYLVDSGSFILLHLTVLGFTLPQKLFPLSIRTIHLTAAYLIIYAVFHFKEKAKVRLSKTYVEKLEADRRAMTDELTDCYNYRFLRQELLRLRQEEKAVRLIFIDMDNFKQINDLYGHPTGDRVLKEVAQTIKNNLRETDFLIRYGGDEFCIILGGETGKDPDVAKRLREVVSGLRFSCSGEEFGVSFSVGEAEDNGADSPEDILSQADKKLYQEKNARKKKEI